MTRFILLAGACALAAATVATAAQARDYNVWGSRHAAHTWRAEAAEYAPQAPAAEAEAPNGPTLIASRPVPDTRANRARFGQPLSLAGRMTAPIGD
ncbi:MAG: hypothetical protein ACREEW_09630 [Caulobacteraceae bacterium]